MISAREAYEPALAFLQQHLLSPDRMVDGEPVRDGARRYRFEHSQRVARIGRLVADGEGFDADLLALGCLLHDVGKFDAERAVDHGRAGALIADKFLTELGLPSAQRLEIVQGIAMHTDDLWNPRTDDEGTSYDVHGNPYLVFDSEPSLLARSIGDCDNIDRFGAYRVADTLKYIRFMELPTAEQRTWLAGYRGKLDWLWNQPCATATATRLWREAVDVQRSFFARLAEEIG
ncbi:HD domain-containing protein [Arcanobacterium phocisimile]|uniref:HD domain-containing protein n=1 Tax=Arcanobacterium phocisimile TaxID=1302235 RepID=A0ABX7IGS9_9ACTO|nr:HD domain-containing protein [Arcanobacterium phocisimile]QRV02162.1 HD domain-containing protein [Arcanobacterium phocisimile]